MVSKALRLLPFLALFFLTGCFVESGKSIFQQTEDMGLPRGKFYLKLEEGPTIAGSNVFIEVTRKRDHLAGIEYIQEKNAKNSKDRSSHLMKLRLAQLPGHPDLFMLQMNKTNYNYFYVAKMEGNQLWVNNLKVSKEELKRASNAGLEGIQTSKVRVTNRRQLEEYVNYWLETKGGDWISDRKTTMTYTVLQNRTEIASEKQNYLDLMCLSSAGHPDDPKMKEHKLDLPRGIQLGAIDPKIAHKYCAHGLKRNANPSVTYALARILYKEKKYKGTGSNPGALDLANRLRDRDFPLSYILLADAYSGGKGVSKNLDTVKALLNEGPPEDPNILYAKGLYNYLGILKPLDNNKNREYFTTAANKGHGTAMVWLGKMMEAGHGGPKDINKALAMYRKSNALGNLDGKMALGKAYYFGRGVKQSYERSLGYIKPAASMKHAEANFYLGYMYSSGLGVKANRSSSLKHYERAIKAGHTHAKGGYAVAYYDDMQKAKEGKSYHRWLVDSANSGQKAAKYVLARKHLIGFDVPRSLTKALSMLEENIADNHTPSMNYMAGLYEQGRRVQRDYKEAFRYYKMSADRGNSEAIYKVGIFYHQGRQGNANKKFARQWYEKAAQTGHSDAQVRTAILYHFPNDGSPPNLKLARQWYEKAYKQGNADAMWRLGAMQEDKGKTATNLTIAAGYYRESALKRSPEGMIRYGQALLYGRGTGKNTSLAKTYLERAAKTGHARAQYTYGAALRDGSFGQKNPVEAKKWFTKAANQGNKAAKIALNRAGSSSASELGSEEWARIRKFERLANQGNVNYMYQAGLAYLNKAKDPTQAKKYFRMGAGRGDSYSQYYMGVIHSQYQKYKTNWDPVKALMWLYTAEKSALKANKDANFIVKYYRALETNMRAQDRVSALDRSNSCISSGYKFCN